MRWIICLTCRWADGDGAGHFMCTDYSPPELDGEGVTNATMRTCRDGDDPRLVCASYADTDE